MMSHQECEEYLKANPNARLCLECSRCHEYAEVADDGVEYEPEGWIELWESDTGEDEITSLCPECQTNEDISLARARDYAWAQAWISNEINNPGAYDVVTGERT